MKFKLIREDGGAPTNIVGSGQVAGVGVPNPSIPNQAEPGFKRKTLKDILKRKSPNNGEGNK